jgi:predicted nucleic acid-binding protein
MPLRVAIDTNVLIAGLGWPRWQHEILKHAAKGDFTLILSPIVIQETKRRFNESLPHLAEGFASFLVSTNYELAPVPTKDEIEAHQSLVRQAKDIPLALSVIAAHVDYFVTYDRDFTEEDTTTQRVRQAISGIRLPPVFLREVMGWTSEELEAIRHREWSDIED